MTHSGGVHQEQIGFVASVHAKRRMSQRGISAADVAAVLKLGRRRHAQGALFYIVGKSEVERYGRQGLDVRRLANLQVLVGPQTGHVITVFRNPRLPRK